jgi:lysophospholipase L1-like esterase
VKIRHTLAFIVIILSLLGSISAFFPEEGVAFGERKLYFLTLEDILSNDSNRSASALQRVKALEESLRLQQYQDSLYADSLAFYTRFFRESPLRIRVPNENWNYLNDFFSDLDSCRARNEIVHILHYGDSQIESDRITGYIRQHLQEQFGGEGPGLLPAVQPLPSAAVGQSASENIERYIVSGMHQNRAPHKRYGALGQVGMINGQSSISIATRNWKDTYANVRKFQTVRLFVGHDKNLKARLTSSGKEIGEKTVADSLSPVKVFTWALPESVNKCSLHLSGSAEVYGIAADGIAGVAVDNVPFRGSSGIFFNTLDSAVLASMYKELNTRLILLEFGGNMMPSIRGPKAIATYRTKLAEQIAFLRKICPEAKILLIGPSDMSTKVNGKLRTYPYLEPMIEAMEEAACYNGAAFWNLYEVMGGNNSMIEWVKHSPALAAPDYIHFTVKGAERAASLLCETLMVYYDYYRFVNGSPSPQKPVNE